MSERKGYDVAKRVLTRCSAIDPWFPQPSQATALAWGEIFDRCGYNFTDAEIDKAVDTVYDRGGDVRPKPGDFINAAIADRQDQFERQPRETIEAHWDAIDARLADRIEEVADNHSVDTTLAIKYQRPTVNPRTVQCPYDGCRAIPGRPCKSGNHTMRRYHDSRIDAAVAENALPPGTQQ